MSFVFTLIFYGTPLLYSSFHRLLYGPIQDIPGTSGQVSFPQRLFAFSRICLLHLHFFKFITPLFFFPLFKVFAIPLFLYDNIYFFDF